MQISNQLALAFIPDETLDSNIIELGDARWYSVINSWQQSALFGFDLETFGADPEDGLHPWKGEIRLITVGLNTGETLLVDLGGFLDDREERYQQIATTGFFDVLAERLANPKVMKVGTNLKFDQLWMLVKFGFKTRTVRDVMLMSQVYWAGMPSNFRHGLGALASRLGFEVDKTEQTSDWGWQLTNAQKNYAAIDSQVVIPIFHKLWRLLQDAGLKGQGIVECGASPAFAQMEFVGMPVDGDLLEETLQKYKGVEVELLKPFTDTFPNVNPGSSDQVAEAFKTLGIHEDNTDASVLAKYEDRPEVKALSLWRSLSKSIEYLESVKKYMFDGAVRGKYNQMAPKGFGRSTCSSPNLQNPPNPNNLPKELKQLGLPPVRTVFRCPPGKKLIVADLSQAHARIATQASQDRTLLKAYNDNLDVHLITASKLAALQNLGPDWTPENMALWRKDKTHSNQEKTEKLRQVSKPVYYGSLNRQGWATLQSTARTDAGIELTEKEAKQAIKAWATAYSGLHKFQQHIVNRANAFSHSFEGVMGDWGEVRGLSGRRIFMRKHQSDFRPSDAPSVKSTDAVSFYWTSTEADVIKLAMTGCLSTFDQNPEWEAAIANCAHDELDVVCNAQYSEAVARCVQIWMQAAMKMWIKDIPVDEPGADFKKMICDSWAEK